MRNKNVRLQTQWQIILRNLDSAICSSKTEAANPMFQCSGRATEPVTLKATWPINKTTESSSVRVTSPHNNETWKISRRPHQTDKWLPKIQKEVTAYLGFGLEPLTSHNCCTPLYYNYHKPQSPALYARMTRLHHFEPTYNSGKTVIAWVK